MNTQKLSSLQQKWADARKVAFKAILAGLGRTAARNGVCLFDCPYEAGTENAETWMAAHSEEVNKMGIEVLTA